MEKIGEFLCKAALSTICGVAGSFIGVAIAKLIGIA